MLQQIPPSPLLSFQPLLASTPAVPPQIIYMDHIPCSPSYKWPPCELFTIDIITLIRVHLDLNTLLHAAIYACLTTTFFATARVSKFTLATLSSFDPKLHIHWADISIIHNCQGLEVHNLHLPHTRSSPLGEDVNWAKQHGQSNPYTALMNHFKINGPPAEGPHFAYWQDKGYQPLTKKKFLLTLSSMAKKAGIKPLNGHGIHIGSTLKYLLCNVPFEVVKVKGRWVSDAFLTYLRHHAQILTPYMQAQPAVHESFIRYTIPPIRH
ncbi:hypothetical protein PAXRUDRAFT_17174 [Paxillus rubicundulus Ve08.2h10]|uniref:Uncharacterized protein n=1 Tax=Paxillus rubicundulus Ve08.2h10 TaxID=930991 RepID=A0A0D0C4B4_9AGAM|nr:hypothetical protein PAXRUDRAFT_17174 [Paxillus rubicundulus Ve08.2h10]